MFLSDISGLVAPYVHGCAFCSTSAEARHHAPARAAQLIALQRGEETVGLLSTSSPYVLTVCRPGIKAILAE